MKWYSSILATLLSLMVASSALGQTWNIGPISTVAFDELAVNENGDVILGRFETSSCWISTDAGNTWFCLDQRIADIQGATFDWIDIHIIDNEDQVIVITAQDYDRQDKDHLLVSFDSGVTWEVRTPPSIPYVNNTFDFKCHPEDEEYWLIQTDEFCFYSYDSGLNWNSVRSIAFTQNYRSSGIFTDPNHPERIYNLTHYSDSENDLTHYHYEIFRTYDGPVNWDLDEAFIDINEELNLSTGFLREFIPLSNGAYLANVFGTPLDSTEQWYRNNGALFNAYGNLTDRVGGENTIYELFFEDKVVPGRIYARLRWTGTLGVSEDYGLTWHTLEMQGLPDLSYYRIDALYQAENSQTLYASILSCGLFKSEDHGLSWMEVNPPEVSQFLDLCFTPESISLTNGGINWYKYDRETDDIVSFGVPHTPDSIRWHSTLQYDQGDTLLGYVQTIPYEYPETRIFRSFDGGDTWEGLVDVFNKSVRSYSEENYLRLLYEGNDTLYVTEDFGSTWHTIPQPVNEDGHLGGYFNCMDRDFYYAPILNTSTNTYQVYKLPVNGEDWVNTGFENGSDSYPQLFTSPNGVFMTDYEGNTSFYDGDTWESRSPMPVSFESCNNGLAIPSEPTCIILYSNLHSRKEVYFSPDDGWSWYNLEIDFPNGYRMGHINRIKYDQYEEKVWLVTDGLLFWFPLETLLAAPEQPVKVQPADFNLFTAYPNPFNASTRIQYHLEKPGNVKLDVFDITGRLVKTLEDNYKPAGGQSVFFDGSGLASGTYFLQLSTNNEKRSRRITLVK